MKKKEIKDALAALKPIKIQRIADKALREALLADTLTMLSEQRRYEQDAKDLEKALLGAYEADREEVADLQARLQRETDRDKRQELQQEIDKHADLFAAVRTFNKTVITLGEQEITIKGMDREKFLSGLEGQDHDIGLIEAVFPMFNE